MSVIKFMKSKKQFCGGWEHKEKQPSTGSTRDVIGPNYSSNQVQPLNSAPTAYSLLYRHQQGSDGTSI